MAILGVGAGIVPAPVVRQRRLQNPTKSVFDWLSH
jgi:hypothetical protein